MNEAALAQTVLSAVIFLIFLGFLIWGIRSGQFKDVEEAKYRALDDGKEEIDTGGGER